MVPAVPADDTRRIALVDLLDRVLGGGVVITDEITLSLADVEMVRISLRNKHAADHTATVDGVAAPITRWPGTPPEPNPPAGSRKPRNTPAHPGVPLPPAVREHAAVTDHDWQDAIAAHENARAARLNDQTVAPAIRDTPKTREVCKPIRTRTGD